MDSLPGEGLPGSGRAGRDPGRFAGAIAFGVILCVYAAMFPVPKGDRVEGDGFYTWLFARSMALDGDLDLTNDYRICGDPWGQGNDEGGGRPANPFYLGPALLWAPVLAVVMEIQSLPEDAPVRSKEACAGPWANTTLMLTPLIAALTALLGYLLARRWSGPWTSAAAMLVVGLGGPLMHWGAMVVQYSHAYAAFGVALGVLAWVRAVEAPLIRKRWLLAGMGIGVAAVMRSQEMLLLMAPAITLALRLGQDLRARRNPLPTLVAGGLVLAGFASVFWIQILSNVTLYGKPWVIPQGALYLQLAHAHPFLTLFAARNGMLSWHPLLWLGVIGIGVMIARRSSRVLGIALWIPLAIDVYVNSAAIDWHGAASFGARRLVALAAPLVATTALCLDALWRWLSVSRLRLGLFAAAGWLIPWVVIGVGMSIANVEGEIPFDKAVAMPELYSTGARRTLRIVHDAVGNPASWPASLPFALRYGVAPRIFDRFSGGGMFRHTYRPVQLGGPNVIDFRARAVEDLLVEGLSYQADGVHVQGGVPGRFLVELEWPFVTHVAVTAKSASGGPAGLSVVSGSLLGGQVAGTIVVPPGGGTVEFAVPEGAFDSGVNEIVIASEEDVVLESWKWIDRGTYDTSL